MCLSKASLLALQICTTLLPTKASVVRRTIMMSCLVSVQTDNLEGASSVLFPSSTSVEALINVSWASQWGNRVSTAPMFCIFFFLPISVMRTLLPFVPFRIATAFTWDLCGIGSIIGFLCPSQGPRHSQSLVFCGEFVSNPVGWNPKIAQGILQLCFLDVSSIVSTDCPSSWYLCLAWRFLARPSPICI